MSKTNDLWVFGYGSLMWRPGFDHTEAVHARLDGWHRAPCVLSHVHRGTPERPGIVLGLDREGFCEGMAFRVADANRVAVIKYLRGREQVTMVYQEQLLSVVLASGETVDAITFTVDRTHEQYAHALGISEMVERIAGASGQSGENPDYFRETGAKLAEMKIRDKVVEQIVERLGPAR